MRVRNAVIEAGKSQHCYKNDISHRHHIPHNRANRRRNPHPGIQSKPRHRRSERSRQPLLSTRHPFNFFL